jgi:hypothetical protein
MFDCPKCVTVCKAPHCVTHCQAPKPECEAVCEEPKCDWKCHKPACPKPKCELVCENPNCAPKVECCPCAAGAAKVASAFPFFKETEKDPNCCGCATKPLTRISQEEASAKRSREIHDFGTHVVQNDVVSKMVTFDTPRPIGDSYYAPNKGVQKSFEKNSQKYSIA